MGFNHHIGNHPDRQTDRKPPNAAGWRSVQAGCRRETFAFKLRPNPDEVQGTAQPGATPAGHRVKGPGYGQKPSNQRV